MKSAGSVVVTLFVVMGVVWFWRDQAGFEAFLAEAVNKGADLVTSIFDVVFDEIRERSSA